MRTNAFSDFVLGKPNGASRSFAKSSLSDGAGSDGFIQEFIWEHQQNEELGIASAQRDDSTHNEQEMKFKFVAGRPKQKRRPRLRKAGEYDGYSHHFRISSSATSPPSNTKAAIQILESAKVEDQPFDPGDDWKTRRDSTFADAWSLSTPSPLLQSPSIDEQPDLSETYGPEYHVVTLSDSYKHKTAPANSLYSVTTPWLLHAILWHVSQNICHEADVLLERADTLGCSQSQSTKRMLRESHTMILSSEITQTLDVPSSMFGIKAPSIPQSPTAGTANPRCEPLSSIALFVWWDITHAFLTRQEPYLPHNYLQSFVDSAEHTQTSFMTLNGCPIFLMKAMIELSRLASLYQKAAISGWSIFDDMTFKPLMSGLSQRIKSEKVDLEKLDGFHADQGKKYRHNHYHCIEAWRSAVLLYGHRVFDRQRDESTPSLISQLAHMVIDHVRWIPEDDEIAKQLVIPVFLAGAEMTNETNRGFVRRYCTRWSQTDSFGQFQRTYDELDVIWGRADSAEGTSSWWGQQVNSDSCPEPTRGCEVWLTQVIESQEQPQSPR